MGKALLTLAGYQKILRELRHLSQEVRPQARAELMEAALEGCGEHNTAYQEARSRQARVERRIRQLQHILSDSEVLVGSNLTPSRVVFNSRVKVLNLQTGKTCDFHLVGAVEADAGQGHLSVASPLGRALLGHQVGERVYLEAPGGRRDYQILAIALDVG